MAINYTSNYIVMYFVVTNLNILVSMRHLVSNTVSPGMGSGFNNVCNCNIHFFIIIMRHELNVPST